jgi:hypothetical protein
MNETEKELLKVCFDQDKRIKVLEAQVDKLTEMTLSLQEDLITYRKEKSGVTVDKKMLNIPEEIAEKYNGPDARQLNRLRVRMAL